MEIRHGLENLGKSVGRVFSPGAQKSSGLSFDQAFSFRGGSGPFNSYRTKKQQLESYLDWVYAAVHAISEDVGQSDFKVFVNRSGQSNRSVGLKLAFRPQETEELQRTMLDLNYTYGKKTYTRRLKALEEVDNHQVVDILSKPNKWQSADEFFEMMAQHVELTGDAFALKLRDGRGVVEELWPLMPHLMIAHADAANFLSGWTYEVNGKRIPFLPEDIIHVKTSNPSHMIRGIGVVEAAARSVDADTQSADFNRRFFKNAARPDAALETANNLDDKTFHRLKKEFQDQYGGVDNAHKTVLLEAGVKFKPMNFNHRDMEFLNARKFNRDQMLAMFRVSPAILGMVEDVNRANAEASEYIFAKRTIKPKVARIAAKLTDQLAAEFDSKLVISFSDPVPVDKEFDRKFKNTAVDSWMTKDEIRALEGLEPLDGGVGSVIYAPINQRPLTGVPPAGDGEDKKFSTGSGKTGDKSKKKLAGSPRLKSGDLYSDSEEREALGRSRSDMVEKLAPVYEADFIAESRKRFNQQRQEVNRNIRASGYEPVEDGFSKAAAKNLLTDFMFDKARENRLMVAAFLPIYTELIETFGEQALLLVSATQPFDPGDPGIKRFMDSRATRISREINDETEKQLRATLSEGINAGETIDELSARVNSTMGNMADYRAQRIARTESIRSNTFADIEAWRQSGVVRAKEWFIADTEACDWCQYMNGVKTDLEVNYFSKGTILVQDEDGEIRELRPGEDDAEFAARLKMNYEDISGPPSHVNCRCVLLPVLEEV